MDLNLKEGLVFTRNLFTNLAEAVHNFIPQFPTENIATVIVIVLCFWLVSTVVNMVSNKVNLLYKILLTGGLFYVLWLI